MKRTAAAILCLLIQAVSGHADSYAHQPSVDILHYEISIELDDRSNVVAGTTSIDIAFRSEGVSGMWLDLAAMQVDGLYFEGKQIPFTHSNGRLSFQFDREYDRGETCKAVVHYHGTADGTAIRIGRNRYGDRVYFTDNWPDLAQTWFPSIDHPSDKATVDFNITAPRRYTVVANGRLTGIESLPDSRRITRWSETHPAPTYSMAFGAADFSVTIDGETLGIPISWYVYPEDRKAGSQKFRRTAGMLRYFSETIGAYPFKKLAHVESNTRMAAMENTDTIFYSETLFYPLPVSEEPVAHEIAHQWFGNSVTPADWDQLWLSEGFATYFDALFNAATDDSVSIKELMAGNADRIFAYPTSRSRPVIDPGLTDLMKKLNPLNYEKGAWVLHMLRGLIGDEAFFEGIRRYYSLHAGGNVRTVDFRKAMESAGGKDLDAFFSQWLYQPAWPEYRLRWDWDDAGRAVTIHIRQTQDTGLFDMPMDIVLSSGNRKVVRRIRVSERDSSFRVQLSWPPSAVEIDPDGWILKTLVYEN